jgi:hypothetical protein
MNSAGSKLATAMSAQDMRGTGGVSPGWQSQQADNRCPQTLRKEREFFSFYSRIAVNEIWAPLRVIRVERIDMKKSLAIVIAIAGISFATASAHAQERLGDGAMGALAGALVGGPIGLVAGGVVGYTAGPSIASSWGLKGHRHYRRVHYRRHPSNTRPGSGREDSLSPPQNL